MLKKKMTQHNIAQLTIIGARMNCVKIDAFYESFGRFSDIVCIGRRENMQHTANFCSFQEVSSAEIVDLGLLLINPIIKAKWSACSA